MFSFLFFSLFFLLAKGNSVFFLVSDESQAVVVDADDLVVGTRLFSQLILLNKEVAQLMLPKQCNVTKYSHELKNIHDQRRFMRGESVLCVVIDQVPDDQPYLQSFGVQIWQKRATVAFRLPFKHEAEFPRLVRFAWQRLVPVEIELSSLINIRFIDTSLLPPLRAWPNATTTIQLNKETFEILLLHAARLDYYGRVAPGSEYFPGYCAAPRQIRTLLPLNSSHIFTNLYASPGSRIRVHASNNIIEQILIGVHCTRLQWQQRLRRWPYVCTQTSLKEDNTEIFTSFGGLLSLRLKTAPEKNNITAQIVLTHGCILCEKCVHEPWILYDDEIHVRFLFPRFFLPLSCSAAQITAYWASFFQLAETLVPPSATKITITGDTQLALLQTEPHILYTSAYAMLETKMIMLQYSILRTALELPSLLSVTHSQQYGDLSILFHELGHLLIPQAAEVGAEVVNEIFAAYIFVHRYGVPFRQVIKERTSRAQAALWLNSPIWNEQHEIRAGAILFYAYLIDVHGWQGMRAFFYQAKENNYSREENMCTFFCAHLRLDLRTYYARFGLPTPNMCAHFVTHWDIDPLIDARFF